MDPNSTLRDLIDAAVNAKPSRVREHAGDLADWFNTGGFAPDDPRRRPKVWAGHFTTELKLARHQGEYKDSNGDDWICKGRLEAILNEEQKAQIARSSKVRLHISRIRYDLPERLSPWATEFVKLKGARLFVYSDVDDETWTEEDLFSSLRDWLEECGMKQGDRGFFVLEPLD